MGCIFSQDVIVTAAKSGDLNTVRGICSRGGCNLEVTGDENRTALHWAATHGYLEIVKCTDPHLQGLAHFLSSGSLACSFDTLKLYLLHGETKKMQDFCRVYGIKWQPPLMVSEPGC